MTKTLSILFAAALTLSAASVPAFAFHGGGGMGHGGGMGFHGGGGFHPGGRGPRFAGRSVGRGFGGRGMRYGGAALGAGAVGAGGYYYGGSSCGYWTVDAWGNQVWVATYC